MSFLKDQKAKLIIGESEINLGSSELPEITYSSVKIPSRTKKLVKIPVKDTYLIEGYIWRVNAGPGVFIRKSLVIEFGDCVKCYAVSSNASDVSLILPPIDLEEYAVVSLGGTIGGQDDASTTGANDGVKEKAKRFTEILKLIDLKN